MLSEQMRRLPIRVREEDRYDDANKKRERDKIARQTEAFLAAGGRVDSVPTGPRRSE